MSRPYHTLYFIPCTLYGPIHPILSLVNIYKNLDLDDCPVRLLLRSFPLNGDDVIVPDDDGNDDDDIKLIGVVGCHIPINVRFFTSRKYQNPKKVNIQYS